MAQERECTEAGYYYRFLIILLLKGASRGDQSLNLAGTVTAKARADSAPRCCQSECLETDRGMEIIVEKEKGQNSETKLNAISLNHSRPATNNCRMSKPNQLRVSACF